MAFPDLANVLRMPQPEQSVLPDAVDIEVELPSAQSSSFDPQTNTIRIVSGDGSVEIQPVVDDQDEDDSDHFANLADKIPSATLAQIADELLRGIEQDDQSRQPWLENYANGIGLLGLELKYPNTSSASGAQLEGTSKVNSTLLKEAVLRFQANARGELLPTDGPVKIRDDGETKIEEDLAEALQSDFNHYLTTVASEYYPDTDRALFYTGLGGLSIKKVYNHPLKRRPVSESIEVKDFIVSNAATDIASCMRKTHRFFMSRPTLRRMQIYGAYRDVALQDGLASVANPVDQKIAEVQGIQPNVSADYAKDRDRELYECYCQIEIDGYEHKEKGKLTGIPLPWKVTIDKDSRQVLEVRRNWDPDDDMCMERKVFVKYPFVPGLGFYDIGLLHILGDLTLAATASLREQLDAAAFSCFPGFLYRRQAGKQLTNEFRIPPGGGQPFDTASDDIRKDLMALPYQPPNQAQMALFQELSQMAQRVGGTAELQVGDGRQDAPVGTTLALIDQASKPMDAVHKRIYQAQSEEFQLLRERFMEDPEALWRHNKKSKVLKLLMGATPQSKMDEAAIEQSQEKAKQRFKLALSDMALVPMADPNTSSQMARQLKAEALKQLQAANPTLYDAKEVDTRILKAMNYSDIDGLFAKPNPNPQPNPDMMEAQAKMMTAQAKLTEVQLDAKRGQTDNEIQAMKIAAQTQNAKVDLAKEQIIHQADLAKIRQDAVDKHLDRQAGLAKHAMTIDAQHRGQNADSAHKHMDRAADLYKHGQGLASAQAAQNQQQDINAPAS